MDGDQFLGRSGRAITGGERQGCSPAKEAVCGAEILGALISLAVENRLGGFHPGLAAKAVGVACA